MKIFVGERLFNLAKSDKSGRIQMISILQNTAPPAAESVCTKHPTPEENIDKISNPLETSLADVASVQGTSSTSARPVISNI